MSRYYEIRYLLGECTVRIEAHELGTGFFVAPGYILTCAHVVKDCSVVKVTWKYTGNIKETVVETNNAKVEAKYGDPDLALIIIENVEQTDFKDHPCVLLEDDERVNIERILAWGYPVNDDYNQVAKVAIHDTIDGIANLPVSGGEVFNLKAHSVSPGMSGGPVLNRDTLKVCGMIKSSRGVNEPNTGGRAIPSRTIFHYISKLGELNRTYHSDNPRWIQLLPVPAMVAPSNVGVWTSEVLTQIYKELEDKDKKIFRQVIVEMLDVDDRAGLPVERIGRRDIIKKMIEDIPEYFEHYKARSLYGSKSGNSIDLVGKDDNGNYYIGNLDAVINWEQFSELFPIDALRTVRLMERRAIAWKSNVSQQELRAINILPEAQKVAEFRKALRELELDLEIINPLIKNYLNYEQGRWINLLNEHDLKSDERREFGRAFQIYDEGYPSREAYRKGIVDAIDVNDGVSVPSIEWCRVETEMPSVPGGVYYIAKYPVTVAQFELFLQAHQAADAGSREWMSSVVGYSQTGYLINDSNMQQEDRVDKWNYPCVHTNFYDAVMFCHWLNKYLPTEDFPSNTEGNRVDVSSWIIRLPTGEEWKYALWGNDRGKFPWTDDNSAANDKSFKRLNFPSHIGHVGNEITEPMAVGLYPAGESISGALDMIGNVWEWTLDKQKDKRRVWGLSGAAIDMGMIVENKNVLEDRLSSVRLPVRPNNDVGFRVVCVKKEPEWWE